MRSPSPGELQAALDAHDLWSRSEGREGRAADFTGLDLSGLDLRKATLRRADLRGLVACGADMSGACLYQADLRGARLGGANLKGADLARADLRGADLNSANLLGAGLAGAQMRGALLRRATLRDAVLSDADLTDAVGLLAGQFGGADLAGAALPPDPARFDGLANVAEVSKATQNLFTTIVLVCAYTWLTIASTTDAQLLNNAVTASSRLPVLGVDIPLTLFYAVTPFLLLSLYIFFQLNLQRLWEELADLPAVFPDGRALDRKAYPWLLNVLVRSRLPRLREAHTSLTRWQARFSVLIAWGLVPLTAALTWARYLRCHDRVVTGLHVAVLAGAAGAGVAFLRLASSTVRGSERKAFRWRRAWEDARALGFASAAEFGVILSLASIGVIDGVNPDSVYDEAVARRLAGRFASYDVRRWVPGALGRLGLSTSAVLYDANLSTKPANWSPTSAESLDAVRGADLERRDLRHALGYNAFGVNSYLRDSDARWADLREADLRRADFRRARLRGTNFRYARLSGADFRNADLSQARLKDVDSQGAKFGEADLRGATLTDSRLCGSDFTGADLSGASLRGTRLGPFSEAPGGTRNTLLCGARLDGADLTGADLTGADLTGADLTGASLRRATLTGALLDRAVLDGADLGGATGLTGRQWSSAHTDRRTRRPDEKVPP